MAEREAGRADAAGEVLGRKGRGSARARNAEAAAAAAVAAALQLAPRSGLRRRAGERVSTSGQTPGRTTPATRARRRHRIHPGAAQAPRAGKEARPGGPVATAEQGRRQPWGASVSLLHSALLPRPCVLCPRCSRGGWWWCRAGLDDAGRGVSPRGLRRTSGIWGVGGGEVGGFSHSQGAENAGDGESDKRSWGGWWVAGEKLLVE